MMWIDVCLKIEQNLSGYRKQGDEEASEIVNLQR